MLNIKRSSYDFNLYLVHVGISSVGRCVFFQKNHSHLVLIGYDLLSLVLSDNLNECGVDWMHLLQG
jgi:hypothetical protein